MNDDEAARRISDAEGVSRFGDATVATTDLARFARRVLDRAGWSSCPSPKFVFDVSNEDAERHAFYDPKGGVIHLRNCAPDWSGVLHELAHHVAPGRFTHGSSYTGDLLRLVDAALGPVARWRLATAFEQLGVRVGASSLERSRRPVKSRARVIGSPPPDLAAEFTLIDASAKRRRSVRVTPEQFTALVASGELRFKPKLYLSYEGANRMAAIVAAARRSRG